MSYSLDVEHFISEIAKRPVIWNFVSENENRSQAQKLLKMKAWEDVARNFIPDIDDMSTLEREEVYRKLHNKWRNIRDSYVRNKKKRPGQKNYMYAKHLGFLDNVYKDYKPNSNNSQTEYEVDWDDTDNMKKSNFQDIEYVQDDSDNSFDEPLSKNKIKRIKKEEDNPIEYFETPIVDGGSCSFTVEDEDKSFFESLLPSVRSFDIDQKLEFRTEVLSLIKKIRKYKNT